MRNVRPSCDRRPPAGAALIARTAVLAGGLALAGCGPAQPGAATPERSGAADSVPIRPAAESAAAPSPTPAGATVSTQPPFTRLATAETSGFTEATELVVRDASAAAQAWQRLHQGVPGTAPPAVDFSRQMIVLLALGERSTGGHAVRFDSLTVDPAGAVVRYTATSPAPSCMTAQMITSPVEAVLVPRVDGEVRFERRSVVQAC